jgi:acetyltransferase-like isoleucine patch superfamily enzyme
MDVHAASKGTGAGASASPTRKRDIGIPTRLKGCLRLEEPAIVHATDLHGDCRIGAFTYFNRDCVAYSIQMGRYGSVAQQVLIGPTNHPTGWLSSHLFAFGNAGGFRGIPEFEEILSREAYQGVEDSATIIGHDVWIGARAFVRRGIRIGDGAIIAAGAAVVSDVEPFAIVGGVPARPIRMRFSDHVIERIRRVQWWDYLLHRKVLGPIAYSDPERALDVIEARIAEGRLERLMPRIRTFRGSGFAPKIVETTAEVDKPAAVVGRPAPSRKAAQLPASTPLSRSAAISDSV